MEDEERKQQTEDERVGRCRLCDDDFSRQLLHTSLHSIRILTLWEVRKHGTPCSKLRETNATKIRRQLRTWRADANQHDNEQQQQQLAGKNKAKMNKMRMILML